MKVISQHFFIKNIQFFIFFSILITIACVKTDFDYHRKKRLNNGNYLVMTTQGIYRYNEEFNSKKDG